MREAKTVNLVRRVKTPQGWRRHEVATHPNGRVKHNFVYVPAPGATKNTPHVIFYKNRPYREEEFKEGTYELQRYEGGQPVYEPIGNDPVEAKKKLDDAIRVNNAIAD
jgi:hypothetical protein